MKKTLIALSLGLASTTAFANTGTINFHGRVDSGTCPIVIIDPSTGVPMSRIPMGNVNASEFSTPGAEAAARPFAMRVTPGGCSVGAGKATVTFTGAFGAPTGAPALYALNPVDPKVAAKLALVIKDNTGTEVANGTPSKEYEVDDTNPTDMVFIAAYRSLDNDVPAGQADTDVRFVVDIP